MSSGPGIECVRLYWYSFLLNLNRIIHSPRILSFSLRFLVSVKLFCFMHRPRACHAIANTAQQCHGMPTSCGLHLTMADVTVYIKAFLHPPHRPPDLGLPIVTVTGQQSRLQLPSSQISLLSSQTFSRPRRNNGRNFARI